MFMHVAPEASSFHETVSTLKFATRVSEITLGQVRVTMCMGKIKHNGAVGSGLDSMASMKKLKVLHTNCWDQKHAS